MNPSNVPDILTLVMYVHVCLMTPDIHNFNFMSRSCKCHG